MSDELGSSRRICRGTHDWRMPNPIFLTAAGLCCQLSMELETNSGIRMKHLFWSLRDPTETLVAQCRLRRSICRWQIPIASVPDIRPPLPSKLRDEPWAGVTRDIISNSEVAVRRSEAGDYALSAGNMILCLFSLPWCRSKTAIANSVKLHRCRTLDEGKDGPRRR
jgi:hypothetical protein